jgi:hypothetical protein
MARPDRSAGYDGRKLPSGLLPQDGQMQIQSFLEVPLRFLEGPADRVDAES